MTFPGGFVTDHLDVVSVTDGSIRRLNDPGPVPPFELPVRTVAVSESGRRVATSICRAGMEDAFDCGRTSIIDIESGALVRTLDIGELPVSRFTNAWFMTRSFPSVAMFDTDGQRLWSTSDLAGAGNSEATLWDLDIIGGDIFATADGVDGAAWSLVRIEPLSGGHRTLYTSAEGEVWRFWTSWSSDQSIVLSRFLDLPSINPSCGACPANVIAAGVVDPQSEAFDPDAIWINVGP